MKNLLLIGLLVCILSLKNCNSHILWRNESFYEGELVVAGVGPDISFEPTAGESTIVLKGDFENHSDHIFLDKSLFFKVGWMFFTPGNVVKFKGKVKSMDSAAGNHYYEVKSIDKLDLVRHPSVDEVKQIFDSYNYCETDDDCGFLGGECPLGCYIPMNKKFISEFRRSVPYYVSNFGDERCVYDCIAMDKVVCENYKCVMVGNESEES